MQSLLAYLGILMLSVAAWLVTNHIGIACLVFFGMTFIHTSMMLYFVTIRDNQMIIHRNSMIAIEQMLNEVLRNKK